MQSVGDAGVSAINWSNGDGIVLASNVVRALLPVSRRVAISQVVAGQNLVSHYAGTSKGDVEVYRCGPRRAPNLSPP